MADEESSQMPVQNDPQAEKTIALDWDGPTDPGNPQKWPKWKKIIHTVIPALYAFVLTVGISTFVPGLPFVMRHFNISREVALLPVSLYTIGFTIGPLFAAPLSEMYGRRTLYWTNLPMLIIFNAIAGATDSLAVLIVFRFLAGLGGSGVLAVGAGTVSDLWEPKSAGRAALTYIIAPFLGPSLGPLVGAYIIAEYDNNWRFSIWVILFVAAPVGVGMIFMKETSKSRILYLRSKRRGEKFMVGRAKMSVMRKIGQAVLRPLHMCLFEPLASLLSIYTGFSFAMIFSFFGSYSYVYQNVYHFNLKQVGLAYIGLIVGYVLAVITFALFDATLYQKEMARTNGRAAPEHRLYSAMLGSILLPIGLFWFAWTPHESVHWIVPVLAGVPFGWGALDVFLGSITFLVSTYQVTNGASAVAANGILRFSFSAAFPLFIVQMYKALGIHWAGSVFAFVSLGLVPVPWVFFWKGKELRRRSRYDTCDF